MTFDLKTAGTLKTHSSNNACVLTTSLCYVICKDSDVLNIFHNFWLLNLFDPLMTFDFFAISILYAPMKLKSHDQTMTLLPAHAVCGRRSII